MTNVVGRLLPFHRTTDDATNLLPVTVSVKAVLPATAVAGEIEVTTGTGAIDGSTGPLVQIPVTFDGPDLADVAAHWRVGTDEAVRRLEQTAFHVSFCGFAPGFAYLEGLDEELAVPRLPTPRPKVPAGSVGLADRYAGIYPTASPGGWRLVGRTDITLFEPTRRPPALLSPGVRVRFVAVGAPAESPAPGRSRDEAENDRGPVPERAP